MGHGNLQFRDVRFLVQGLWLHEGRKWAIIEAFMIRKFLIAFLRYLEKSSMDAENSIFGQIVSAEQDVVR